MLWIWVTAVRLLLRSQGWTDSCDACVRLLRLLVSVVGDGAPVRVRLVLKTFKLFPTRSTQPSMEYFTFPSLTPTFSVSPTAHGGNVDDWTDSPRRYSTQLAVSPPPPAAHSSTHGEVADMLATSDQDTIDMGQFYDLLTAVQTQAQKDEAQLPIERRRLAQLQAELLEVRQERNLLRQEVEAAKDGTSTIEEENLLVDRELEFWSKRLVEANERFNSVERRFLSHRTATASDIEAKVNQSVASGGVQACAQRAARLNQKFRHDIDQCLILLQTTLPALIENLEQRHRDLQQKQADYDEMIRESAPRRAAGNFFMRQVAGSGGKPKPTPSLPSHQQHGVYPQQPPPAIPPSRTFQTSFANRPVQAQSAHPPPQHYNRTVTQATTIAQTPSSAYQGPQQGFGSSKFFSTIQQRSSTATATAAVTSEYHHEEHRYRGGQNGGSLPQVQLRSDGVLPTGIPRAMLPTSTTHSTHGTTNTTATIAGMTTGAAVVRKRTLIKPSPLAEVNTNNNKNNSSSNDGQPSF